MVANASQGMLYVMGVNGQMLMHYAALHSIDWPDYLQAMRDGIEKYGPVKSGLYALSGPQDEPSNNT